MIEVFAGLSPSPTPTIDENLVTPGPWGFVAIGLIALAAVLLIADMLRRVRRGRYRAEVNAELDAEEAAARQADAADRASTVDDQRADAAQSAPDDDERPPR